MKKGIDCEQVIVVDGVKMTLADYRKSLKEKGMIKPKKRTKKILTDIQEQTLDIKGLVKGCTLLKSLKAYQDHGYKQWGTTCKEILSMFRIKDAFRRYNIAYRALNELVKEVEYVGMKNEKAVYQYLDRLSWKIDDTITAVVELSSAISKSDILGHFRNEKCIYETGRRLGLKVIMSRVASTLIDMNNIIYKCNEYTNKGLSPFEYNQKAFNGMLSCWCRNER